MQEPVSSPAADRDIIAADGVGRLTKERVRLNVRQIVEIRKNEAPAGNLRNAPAAVPAKIRRNQLIRFPRSAVQVCASVFRAAVTPAQRNMENVPVCCTPLTSQPRTGSGS